MNHMEHLYCICWDLVLDRWTESLIGILSHVDFLLNQPFKTVYYDKNYIHESGDTISLVVRSKRIGSLGGNVNAQ